MSYERRSSSASLLPGLFVTLLTALVLRLAESATARAMRCALACAVMFMTLFGVGACTQLRPPQIGQYEQFYLPKEASPNLDWSAGCPLPGDVWERKKNGWLTFRARPNRPKVPNISNPTRIQFPYTSTVVSGVLDGEIRLASGKPNEQPKQLTTSLQSANVRTISVEARDAVGRLLLGRPTGGPAYELALEDVRRNRNGAVLIKETISARSFDYVINFENADSFNLQVGTIGRFLGATASLAKAGSSVCKWPAVVPGEGAVEYIVLVDAVAGTNAVEQATDPEVATQQIVRREESAPTAAISPIDDMPRIAKLETARQFVLEVKTCNCGEKGTDSQISIQFLFDDGTTSDSILCPNQPGDDNEENRMADGVRGLTRYNRPVVASATEIPLHRIKAVRLINSCGGDGDNSGWQVESFKLVAIDTSLGRNDALIADRTVNVRLGCQNGVPRSADIDCCYRVVAERSGR